MLRYGGETVEISKKELLKVTGISYGQLYRWKREGLIPEEWFVKRSSPTGQETYFPKNKILKRIQVIQKLKDQYSLEELAKFLTPEVSNRLFSEDDLEHFEELDVEIAASFMDALDKDNFVYVEVLIMIALSKLKIEQICNEEDLSRMIHFLSRQMTKLHRNDYVLYIYEIQDKMYAVLQLEESEVYVDEAFQLRYSIRLNDISNQIKIKYKDLFNFTFEDEEAMRDESN